MSYLRCPSFGHLELTPMTYKAALRSFIGEVSEPSSCLDPGFPWGGEDVRMGELAGPGSGTPAGQCLVKLNVTVGDSRDEGGRARFMIWNPKEHLIPRESHQKLFDCIPFVRQREEIAL